ncbi:hypothetical protein [Rhizobium sp. CB3171]
MTEHVNPVATSANELVLPAGGDTIDRGRWEIPKRSADQRCAQIEMIKN